jgi:flagellar protein FliO/FliZ
MIAIPTLFAQAGPPSLTDGPSLLRSLLAILVVFGLLALLAWLVRRGGFDTLGRKGPRLIAVETAVALGDRRQLVIVSVEGRRLLLGLTTAQVTLLTELERGTSFDAALDAHAGRGEASE